MKIGDRFKGTKAGSYDNYEITRISDKSIWIQGPYREFRESKKAFEARFPEIYTFH